MKKFNIKTILMKFFAFSLAAMILSANGISFYAAALSYDVSSALEILKSKVEVKKCGTVNIPVNFKETDFDKIIGKAEYITILSVPDKAYGKLSIGGTDVAAGKTVTRRSLESMTFVPAKDTASTAYFTFKNASESESSYGVCTIYILEGLNLAPKPSDSSFDTQKNISYKGFLKASDPESDEVTFSIAATAKNGTVRLLDEKAGYIMYTPKKDFTGRDLFSFRASDKYGNTSETVKVTVHVTEPETDTVFSDMTNHWAHNSAIKLAADGLYGGRIEDGKLVFCPDEYVTRGDFLAMAMIKAGLENSVTRVSQTSFSDDSEIPMNIKSYAEAAYNLGIVSGYDDGNGGTMFRSGNEITRSEASCIISKLISPPEAVISPVFADSASVPSWAASSISALYSEGILNGTGYGEILPSEKVTRAQAAEMLCNVEDYVAEKERQNENREKEELKEKRSLFNLFGLLS